MLWGCLLFFECLLIVTGAACLGGMVGLLLRPFHSSRVFMGLIQSAIGGLYVAIAWWLHSFTPQGFLFRYLLDGTIGIIGLCGVLYILLQLLALKIDPTL